MANHFGKLWILSAALAIALSGCGGDDDNSGGGLAPGNIYGVTNDLRLVRLNAANLSVVQENMAITGLEVGETIAGIDFRPSNGQLVAIGTADNVYTINVDTGAATLVGTGFAPSLDGSTFGVDFNPSVDRIRVVSDARENLRLHPDTGVLVASDTTLAPDGAYAAAAYTPAAMGTPTTLFNIEIGSDNLTRQGGIGGVPSPNGGVNEIVGALGVDFGKDSTFDIAPDGTAFATNVSGGATQVYTINLLTGSATMAGTVGGGLKLIGMSIRP